MENMMLVFEIAGTHFAITSSCVETITVMPELTFMPGMPECISGICQISAKIVPVIDLAKIIEIAHTEGYKCAILIRTGGHDFVISADNVVRTVRDISLSNASGSGASVVCGYLSDATSVIDPDELLETIIRTTEENV